jgi:hypothetical protein
MSETETQSFEYSSGLYDELKMKLETRLQHVQLWKELNHFADLGNFYRDFVENELSLWLNYTTDNETNLRIEERLKRIPFEQAYCYKNPEFDIDERGELWKHVFNDVSMDWRYNPELVRNLSVQDKYRIIKRFEYMCYYVINRREELIYDICDYLK